MTVIRYEICIVFLLFSNCSIIYPTKNPIDAIYYTTKKDILENLIIMLPGRSDHAEDYMKNGFIKAIRESGIEADVIAVDAHSGYYYKKNLIPRLYEDVILPAKQRGYKNIWLMGISMGGMGALLYAKEHSDTLNGVLVLAPFLGDKEIIDEIKAASGLSTWIPKEPLSKEDYQRALWVWLKKYMIHGENLPRLAIGYGQNDQFAVGNGLLAEILPNDQVFVVPGGHEWDTWGRLFTLFLTSGVINKRID